MSTLALSPEQPQRGPRKRASNRRRAPRALRAVALGVLPWVLIGLVFTALGQASAFLAGRPMAFWPSVVEPQAIFSPWVVLAPLVMWGAATARRRLRRWSLRIALFIVVLPAAAAGHAAIFTALWFRLYADGRAFAEPGAMWIAMLQRFLELNALLFLVLVVLAVMRARRSERTVAATPAPVTATPAERLRLRVAGAIVFLAPEDIDRLCAAGDYVEVHTGGRTLLVDESLSALAARLPKGDFARIHRGAVVRLDRISAVRGAGRGDAEVTLRDGAVLRLSRRFRDNIRPLLDDPARSGDGSVPLGEQPSAVGVNRR